MRLVKGADYRLTRNVIARDAVFARGTVDDVREAHEPSPNDQWWWSLRVETLGRNLAVAGALEFAYRLGRAHADFERLQPKKRRKR